MHTQVNMEVPAPKTTLLRCLSPGTVFFLTDAKTPYIRALTELYDLDNGICLIFDPRCGEISRCATKTPVVVDEDAVLTATYKG